MPATGTFTSEWFKNKINELRIPESAIPESHPEWISSGRNRTNADYRRAIAEFYGSKEHPLLGKFPDYESPQLCKNITDINSKSFDIEQIYTSPEFVFQTKLDGIRCLIVYQASTKSFHLYGRNRSVLNCHPIDYAPNHVLFANDLYLPRLANDDFILDCEIKSRENTVPTAEGETTRTALNATVSMLSGPAEHAISMQRMGQCHLDIFVFDCLWAGQNFTRKPYRERLEAACFIADNLQQSLPPQDVSGLMPSFIKIQSTNPSDTKEQRLQFYEFCISSGEEGCVVKDLNALYDMSGNRGTFAIKLKKNLKESIKYKYGIDSIDVFITGGQVGSTKGKFDKKLRSIEFSVYLSNSDDCSDPQEPPVLFATISGFSEDVLEAMSILNPVTGLIELNPAFLGKVYEINGESVSAKSFQCEHPRIVRERLDKQAFDCVLPRSVLSLHRQTPVEL